VEIIMNLTHMPAAVFSGDLLIRSVYDPS